MAKQRSRPPYRRLTQADYTLLAEFRGLLRRFLAFSEAAARQAGLSPQQHQVLLAIKGLRTNRPQTLGDLAEHLRIRHNSAVGQVDRLARMGLLTRGSDPADRRRVTLALTPLAEKLLASLTAAHRDELRRLTPLLKPLLTRLEN
jgi:DNA-binding MarR family transcriptional regulator